MTFEKKTVLITGATGHLGRVVAAAFAARKARLVLVGRDLTPLQQTFGDGPDCALLAADLLDADQSDAAVQNAVERFGGIDVLCHLAGGFRMGDAVHETPAETWDFLIDLNARSFLNISRDLVPVMRRAGDGKVIGVGAFAALRGAAQMGAYTASKSALIRLVEAMSAELKADNINVNCVLPTIIDTPDNRAAMPKADPAEWVSPDALADVILFLASDSARAVHGAALPVTGLS